jgi:hypothetical protein
MIIRQTQLDTFQTGFDKEIVPQVKVYLENNHAQQANHLTAEELDELCRSALKTSRFYDFTETVSLFWFAAMSLELGTEFHTQEAINKNLQSSDKSEEERFRLLFQNTTEKDWIEADKNSELIRNK